MSVSEEFIRRLRNKVYEQVAQQSTGGIPQLRMNLNRSILLRSILAYSSSADKVLRHIESASENTNSFKEFMKAFISITHAELLLNKNPEVLYKHGTPVILYGSHMMRVEPFLLMEQIPRDDITVTTASWLTNMARQTEQHLHTVMFIPEEGNTIQHQGDSFDRNAAIEWNRNSYRRSAQAIENGGLHVIFPTASHSIWDREKQWKGIGRILGEMDPDVIQQTTFLPVVFYGSSIGEILGNCRRFAFGQPQKKLPVKGHFGTSFLGKDIFDSNTPAEQIVGVLRESYWYDPEFVSVPKE